MQSTQQKHTPVSANAIELTGIAKQFPGVVANDSINLSVAEGEIHAICGENGAGKSTLMKILYGMLAPDEGTIRVNGEKAVLNSPTDAIALGIGMVHQHFMLADHLTVLENVIIGAEPMRSLGRIDFTAGRDHFRKISKAYGLDVEPDDFVDDLDIGQRQRVEIIKVLYRGANILILDEPTAVLVPQEVEELFQNIRELKAAGCTVLFIAHKLNEILEIADVITVLRQARLVGTVTPSEVTAKELAEMMIGPKFSTQRPILRSVVGKAEPRNTAAALPVESGETVLGGENGPLDGNERLHRRRVEGGETVLTVENLRLVDESRVVVDSVNLTVHRGEIVGIAGVEGNGQSELIEAILGTRQIASGGIFLLDQNITHTSVRHRREAGLGCIPQDRHREGLLLSSPLWENTALGHQTEAPYSKWKLLSPTNMRSRAQEVCKKFDVRSSGVDNTAHVLSGGNQQKLIVGREMIAEPEMLIAAHPTRGIDVGAQSAVWNEILKAKSWGLATLLVSADLEELIGLSDMLLVMLRGRFVARLNPARLTSRELGAYMTGAAIHAKSNC
ncbi:MAG: ABC transporter ATP-binding protein [Acidimicrobiaceae bacterium]|nr:ABC transporter ATP-binding protein [Acidimicrobiaceae bacterium]